MEEIIEPNEQFPFERLTLAKPTSISGGNYFIKFLLNGNPLYIQPPKCFTKQGISKAGKRLYCDFVYKSENEAFVQWIEKLENFSQSTIFENRDKWFESELGLHDIENSFTSPLKIYKSGKSYILRTNIPTRLGKCALKIYDEDESDIDPDLVKDGTQVITILEVQGIKCSARSFQIEIEAKQMMILQPSKLFDKCILSTGVSQSLPVIPNITTNAKTELQNIVIGKPDPVTVVVDPPVAVIVNPPVVNPPVVDPPVAVIVEPTLKLSNNLIEFELNLDDVPKTETVQLRNRKEVYYTMYREAKKKAKIAKDLALSSYLEAKRIKNTYMLDELSDDSDEDDDDEDNAINNDSDDNDNSKENSLDTDSVF